MYYDKKPYISLLNEIKNGGVEAIKDLVARKESEGYFLDFKRTSIGDYSNKKSLEDSDRNNYARSISGFGNSEGGIIIWGVGTGKDEDVAKDLLPIKSVSNFVSILNSQVSRLTVPQHPSVNSFTIIDNEQGEDCGYVVTEVPKYEGLPIQVIFDYKYYMRAGESFVPITHSVLAGMFGRKPAPNVGINYITREGDPKLEDGFIKFSVGIQLVNLGMGIARDIFLNNMIFTPKGNSKIEKEYSDKNFVGYEVFGVGDNLISVNHLRLAPEQRVQPLTLFFSLKEPFESGINWDLLVGADSQMPHKMEIFHTKEKLIEMCNKYISDSNYPFRENFVRGKNE